MKSKPAILRRHLLIPFVAMIPFAISHGDETVPPGSPDNIQLVERIADLVHATDPGDFEDYQSTIPATGAVYQMVAIPGGSFSMGSPKDEVDRDNDEGPMADVTVSPFWMGKFEVTWDQYEPFMINQIDRNKDGSRKDYDPTLHSIVDGISAPTPPYTEMSFGMGQNGFPAICMTHHSANKFCQWLSAQTGHFYRLPTEAEWEYACRAGASTAYSFPESEIEDYAWFGDNSDGQYQMVGKKQPNAWGLFDMHGNVSEWTADQYLPDYFDKIRQQQAGGLITDPWIRPDEIYPRSVRGGNWDDDPDSLRAAKRIGSDEDWKMQDPQLPRSIWYFTDATGVGFRIVRPQVVPTPEVMNAHWNSSSGKFE